MPTAFTPHSNLDGQGPLPARGQAEPWFRLVLVMVVPLLYLLVGIALTR